MKRSALLLALAVLALVPTVSRADSNTVLQGRVYTADGKPATNVQIEAISPTEWRHGVTDRNGRFVMFGLENDVYTIEAISPRLGRGIVNGTIIAPGETEYVVIPLDTRGCPASGYSVRNGSSYLLNARRNNSTTMRCL